MKNTKLYVMDNGKIHLDKGFLVSMHNPATVDNKHPKATWAEIPIYTVLIDHPDGKILFDTACHPQAMEGHWPDHLTKTFPYEATEECYLPNRLEQLRVRPEDIQYVVVSHLHLDHAGCLDLFTHSEIIVHDDELTNTMRQYAFNKDHGAYVWADIDGWIKAHLNWRPIKAHEDNIELMDGVTILNFGSGHAWGMLGLLVELPDTGNIILASDAIYTRENYGPPVKIPGINYDSLGFLATVERIKKIAKQKNADIWFGHDKEQFSQFRKSTEGYYE